MAAALPWRGKIARLSLAGFALLFARAQTDAPALPPAPDAAAPTSAAFAIIAQSPTVLEVRFRGVTLRGARTDDAQNQIALDFNQPIDTALFDQFQQRLPDWVDMAYGGYDNAVIRARRPVQFLTRNEADGFSIRFVPVDRTAANTPSPVPLRGPADAPPPQLPPGCNGNCPPLDGAQQTDSPFALRGTDGMRGVVVKVGGDWHRASHANVFALRYAGEIPLADGFKIVGSVHAGLANGDNVRHLDGTLALLRRSVVSGSLGVGYDINPDAEVHAAAIYSEAGVGALLGGSEQSNILRLGALAAYRAPYLNTAEEIADRGSHDFGKIFATVRFLPGFWGRAEGRYERFGVKGDDNVASTAGFTAGLRYRPEWFAIPVGFAYDVEGDYVIDTHPHLDPLLNPFVPMNIRTREVHALSAFLSIPFGDGASLDAFGGYAYDRYGPNGPFGGANLAITPADGWKLSIGGLYSQVPVRQGETGTTISASVKLVYDLSSSGDDPFTPGFLPDEI